MPTLSREFIEGFLTQCYDQGISKEAAAVMLQEAALHNAAESPAWMEGFMKGAKDMLEKLEKAASGYFTSNQWSFGDQPGANTLGYGAVGAGLGGGAGLALGRKLPGKFKMLGLLGALGGAVGMGTGAAKDIDVHRNAWAGRVPGSSVGMTYDGPGETQAWRDRVNRLSQGVASSNQEYNSQSERMAELGKVFPGAPGAETAANELQNLRKRHNLTTSERSNYELGLSEQRNRSYDEAARMRHQLNDLEESRGSLWNRLRGLVQGQGHVNSEFDRASLRLQGAESRALGEMATTQEILRRLRGGYTGGDPYEQLNPAEAQDRFFPTR